MRDPSTSARSDSPRVRLLGPDDGEIVGQADIPVRYGVDVDFEGTGPIMERHRLPM